MLGEWFLFPLEEIVVSGHRTLGEAHVPSRGSLEGDSLNSWAAWPLVGVSDLAPDAMSATEARGCGLRALGLQHGRP